MASRLLAAGFNEEEAFCLAQTAYLHEGKRVPGLPASVVSRSDATWEISQTLNALGRFPMGVEAHRMRIKLWEKIFGFGSWHEPVDPREVYTPLELLAHGYREPTPESTHELEAVDAAALGFMHASIEDLRLSLLSLGVPAKLATIFSEPCFLLKGQRTGEAARCLPDPPQAAQFVMDMEDELAALGGQGAAKNADEAVQSMMRAAVALFGMQSGIQMVVDNLPRAATMVQDIADSETTEVSDEGEDDYVLPPEDIGQQQEQPGFDSPGVFGDQRPAKTRQPLYIETSISGLRVLPKKASAKIRGVLRLLNSWEIEEDEPVRFHRKVTRISTSNHEDGLYRTGCYVVNTGHATVVIESIDSRGNAIEDYRPYIIPHRSLDDAVFLLPEAIERSRMRLGIGYGVSPSKELAVLKLRTENGEEITLGFPFRRKPATAVDRADMERLVDSFGEVFSTALSRNKGLASLSENDFEFDLSEFETNEDELDEQAP